LPLPLNLQVSSAFPIQLPISMQQSP